MGSKNNDSEDAENNVDHRTSDRDREDEEEEEGQESEKQSETEESSKEKPEDIPDWLENYEASKSASNPFPPGFGWLKGFRETMEWLKSADELVNPISPSVLNLMRDSDLQKAFTNPVVDPKTLRWLQQPAIDPEMVKAMRQPLIDPRIMEQLTEPAIDPELVQVLQSLDNPAALDAYRMAAAFEQAEQKSVETLEGEPAEADEPPQQGGLLSTFFNATAVNLLFYEDELPDEAVNYLYDLSQSESVQEKKDAFIEVTGVLKESSESAVILLTNAMKFGLTVVISIHSPQLMQSIGDVEDNGDTDEEE